MLRDLGLLGFRALGLRISCSWALSVRGIEAGRVSHIPA